MPTNMSMPWYSDGLKFSCTQCGNCCTGTPGYVWVTDEDVQAIAKHLDKPVGEIRLLHTRPARGKISLTEFPNGDCTFFDPQTRGCKVYPVRPVQCRTWPFWNGNLATPQAWNEMQKGCPGAVCGTLYSLEEIESQRTKSDV